jgi:hypothetical protein
MSRETANSVEVKVIRLDAEVVCRVLGEGCATEVEGVEEEETMRAWVDDWVVEAGAGAVELLGST